MEPTCHTRKPTQLLSNFPQVTESHGLSLVSRAVKSDQSAPCWWRGSSAGCAPTPVAGFSFHRSRLMKPPASASGQSHDWLLISMLNYTRDTNILLQASLCKSQARLTGTALFLHLLTLLKCQALF